MQGKVAETTFPHDRSEKMSPFEGRFAPTCHARGRARTHERAKIVGGAIALLGIVLFAALPTEAKEKRPAKTKSKPVAAPFETRQLSNGLTVLLSPSKAHPVIAASAFVTTGGRTEDEYYQGSLHYIEHLVYKGNTPRFKPTEFRKKVAVLGREAGGWTWDDEINFGFESPKENFAEALDIFHEALHDLKFEEQWFEDEKRVVLQEMQQGLEEPGSLIYESWDALAFDVHPYGRSVIGTEKAILGLKMKPTEQYYRDRFTPNHMILSIAGDFEPAEMMTLLEKEWGANARGPESFELGLREGETLGPRRRAEFMKQATSAMVLSGVVTPGGADENTPALLFLAELLNHPTYGLPQYLQTQSLWVAHVGASHYAMRDAGNFRIFARMDPEKEPAVEQFIHDFVLGFDATKVPREAFETTRGLLLASEARARETAADRAERLGFLASRHGVDGAQTLLDRIQKVTPAEVQAAKVKVLQSRRWITAAVFPEAFDLAKVTSAKVEPREVSPARIPLLEAAGALLPASEPPLQFNADSPVDGVAKFTFENGLRLLVRPTDASSLVAISSRMLGGQILEPEGQEGINRFVSETGLRSTRRWNDETFQLLLGSLGATASAHISVGSRANTSRNVDYRDAAAHHYTGLASQWKELLACLKESMFFPAFDSTEVERARTSLLTEVRAIEEDQLELIKQDFYNRAYAGHPYGRPTVGTEASLKSLGPADLARFHAEHWQPAQCVISIVGNVVPEDVASWVASRWADLPRAGTPRANAPAAVRFKAPAKPVTVKRGKDYWTVNWGKPGASFEDPAWMTSTVLSQIAGNDHFYKYVYGEGVSYRSWIRFWPNLHSGTWILENDVKRERFDEILRKFEEDLKRYVSSGFTETEYRDAVQRLVNSKILDAQTNSLLAWDLAVTEGNGVGFERTTKIVDHLRAVKFDEVQALARTTFPVNTLLRLNQK